MHKISTVALRAITAVNWSSKHNETRRHGDGTGVDSIRGLFVHYTSKRIQRLANNCTQQLFVTVSRDKRISSCLFVRPSLLLSVCLSVGNSAFPTGWTSWLYCVVRNPVNSSRSSTCMTSQQLNVDRLLSNPPQFVIHVSPCHSADTIVNKVQLNKWATEYTIKPAVSQPTCSSVRDVIHSYQSTNKHYFPSAKFCILYLKRRSSLQTLLAACGQKYFSVDCRNRTLEIQRSHNLGPSANISTAMHVSALP